MKKQYLAVVLPVLALTLAACQNRMKKIEVKAYPVARMDSTVDDYFGTQVADPYRWMEDDNSDETAAWVKAENAVTQDYLSQIPYRDQVRERLTELWNFPKYGVPQKIGDYYFFFENDGLRNQSILYRQKGLDGTPEVFLDPNTLSDQGTVALVDLSFSKDDRYLAYAAAASGSDWVEIRVMETATVFIIVHPMNPIRKRCCRARTVISRSIIISWARNRPKINWYTATQRIRCVICLLR